MADGRPTIYLKVEISGLGATRVYREMYSVIAEGEVALMLVKMTEKIVRRVRNGEDGE